MNYKHEIGDRIIDNKRDITIIDRKIEKDKSGIKRKYYKYECNKCGFNGGRHYSSKDDKIKNEYWILETNLEKGVGCSLCSNQISVLGINTIYDTDKWMIPIVGEKFAKIHTHSCNYKINPVCPNCGKIKNEQMSINAIHRNRSIGCSCSDSISFGEKFIYFILKQLKINFIYQLNKKDLKWCRDYKYDFYFEYNSEQYICEVNGLQHYKDAWNKLEITQENDMLKKELALLNGIKPENYIIIDCRKSTLEWIRNNDGGILNGKLAELFDLSNINWNKCNEYACSNLVKLACEYKRNNPNLTTGDIGQLMGGYNRTTIRKWLKQGNDIWCHYDPNEELLKHYIKQKERGVKYNSKNVLCITNGKVFLSTKNCERVSLKIFGEELIQSCISAVCIGKRKQYKGYHFKYIEDLTPDEYKKYDIENKLKELHNQKLVQAC